jgi:hypothetical protein
MYVPDYDEFLIYTTKEEILNYIESLIDSREYTMEEVLGITINNFGKDFSEIIRYLLAEYINI